MSVQRDLLDLGDLFNFCGLEHLTQNIPIECVASALDLSSQATIRRRRLPADQVLWLMLGMALFRDEHVHEVARRLNICAQGLASDHLLARSGVTEARKRLGAEPVEWLFRITGTQWGAQCYRDDAWQDLQVFAVDGALLRTPDTPELRDHFGSGNTLADRQTRRAIDCDGSGQTRFGEGQTVSRTKKRRCRAISGSPSKDFKAKDDEDLKNPVSLGSQGCSA